MSAPVARDRHRDADMAAMKHLHACEEASDAMGEDESLSWEEAGGPAINGDWYCGECEDCPRREIIAAAWPHALAYAADLVAARGLGLTITALHRMLMDEARKATLAGQDVPA